MSATANRPVESLSCLIDPRTHEKFSPNFYKFLRYRRNWSMLQQGTIHRFKPDGQLHFGFKDGHDFLGIDLMSILCRGARARTYCYTNGKDFVSDSKVMDEYLRIGRCAFDPDHNEHYINADGRFVIKGQLRTCQWCGAQHLRKKTRRVVIDEKWVPKSVSP